MLNKLIIFLLVIGFFSGAQELPSASLRDLDGSVVELNKISKKNITVLSFWATCCFTCIN